MKDSKFLAVVLAVITAGLLLGAMMRLTVNCWYKEKGEWKHRITAVMCVNDGSRWDTVWSLLNGKGYIIDSKPFDEIEEAHYPTCDKVLIDGTFRSSKPPLMPTMVAGLTWTIQKITGFSIPERDDIIVRVVLVLINVIPLMIVIILFSGLLDRLGFSDNTKLLTLAATALGTYITSYSITLNNHTLAAIATFLTAYYLIRIKYEAKKDWQYFLGCGFFAAWLVANEMVALVFALPVFFWLIHGDAKKTFLFFLPPGILIGTAYIYTTYLATGSIVPNYLNINTPIYHYPGSYWNNPAGIDAANDPKWFYLFNLTLGHHGIFSLSPIFIFSFWGMFSTVKNYKRRAKESICIKGFPTLEGISLVVSFIIILFYTYKTNNYGGGAQGARWLFWLYPLWLISSLSVYERHKDSRIFYIFACIALAISAVTVMHGMSGWEGYGSAGPWSASWIQKMMQGAKLINY